MLCLDLDFQSDFAIIKKSLLFCVHCHHNSHSSSFMTLELIRISLSLSLSCLLTPSLVHSSISRTHTFDISPSKPFSDTLVFLCSSLYAHINTFTYTHALIISLAAPACTRTLTHTHAFAHSHQHAQTHTHTHTPTHPHTFMATLA